VRDAIDELGPYLTAQANNARLLIPLEDRKEAAADILAARVDQRFEAAYNSLPVCPLDALGAVRLTLDELPECRPPILTYSQLKSMVGLDVRQEIVDRVTSPLPDSIVLTERDMLGSLGEESPIQVYDIRRYAGQGFNFSDEDLHGLIMGQADSTQQGRTTSR
jgi:hypothetical protein